MPKATPFEENGEVTGYMVFCPACNYGHLFNTKPNNPNGVGRTQPTWTFNGDCEKPTFRASMLVKSVELPPRDEATGEFPKGPDGKILLDATGRVAGTKDTVCHSFVTDGKIQFLGDCTHKLAGHTVDLPDMNTLGGRNGSAV